MIRYFLFMIAYSIILTGCGQKSVIKQQVEAIRMNDTQTFVVPLSENEIKKENLEYQDVLPKLGFLTGLIKGVGDIAMKIGVQNKVHIPMQMHVPENPAQLIKAARIQRLFVYIEPKDASENRVKTRMQRFYSWVKGVRNVDFNFIEKLAIRVRSSHVNDTSSFLPKMLVSNKEDVKSMQALFTEHNTHAREVIEAESIKELVLLQYNKKEKDVDLRNDVYGQIYILNTDEPAKLRQFLSDHPKLQNYFQRIHILYKSVLVELQKDPVVQESFEVVLSEEKETLSALKMDWPQRCNPQICLDLNVQDINLIPLLEKDNAITLDAYVEAGKVPESFKLKGFIQIEVKANLNF